MRLELPWPPSILSPNRIAHWRVKAKAKAKYKSDCYYLCKAHGHKIEDTGQNIPIKIIFHPPTKRSFDLDNRIAAMKSGIDGVAEALGVNDKRFKPMAADIGEVIKGGKVVLILNEGEKK